MTAEELNTHTRKVACLRDMRRKRDALTSSEAIAHDVAVLDAEILALDHDLAESARRIERYVESIEDTWTRVLFRLHYVNGLSWSETAHAVGGNTKDSVRMACKRYICSQ